jgi:hypothetical protein
MEMKCRSIKLVVMGMVATVLLFQWHASATAGESDSGQPPSQQLEPITVVDTPASGRADLDPDSLTNPYRVEASARFGTEVFNREDIQDLKPSDVYDLLDKAIGINLSYQGRKSPFFITQRGGGSFTYIIDGAILPPSTNRILYKFPVAAIEELQIVRGATTLTLGPSIPIGASSSGSGLNTGFIIIRTKQPRKTEAVLTGSMEQATGGQPVATSASLYVGTRIKGASNVEGYLGGLVAKADRPSDEDWFDGRESVNGMANTGFKAGKFNLNFMTYTDNGSFEMQRGVKEDGTLDTAKWYYDPLETTIYSTDMAFQWSPNQTTLLNLFQVNYEQTEHNDSFASPTTVEKEYEEETRGVGLRHNARFGNTLLQLGGQMSTSTGFGPNTSKSYNKYDTTVTGWSASLEQTLFDGNLILDGGYRQDTKHIKNSATSAANDDANNDVDMAPAEIFALGAHWQMTDVYSLDGRYYQGRQGTVGDFDMRSLSGDLHPENQDRVEIALAAKLASYFRPALTWFRVDTKNAKSATSTTYELDGATYYYYSESDELRKGVELTVEGDICQNTSYKLSWTHMLDNESTEDGIPPTPPAHPTPAISIP